MSQITLTSAERIQGLTSLRYTEREAAFLAIAALQGGYFLRRQYCQFLGKEVGGTAAALIDKVLLKEHARAITGCSGAIVYHLCARPFYAALGQADNRNRRFHPPMVIKNRLMGLDFVLDHPGETYLSTEREKVDYFVRELGIAKEDLPSKLYRSPTSHAATARYFVDKAPMFVSRDEQAPVSFTFVDEGTQTGARFASYLKDYLRLFNKLRSFRLIYITTPQSPFRSAEAAFRRFLTPQVSSVRPLGLDDLMAHFEDRQLYEIGDLTSFDRARLVRLRDQKQQYAGPEFDRLFHLWQRAGRAAVEHAVTSAARHSVTATGHFESCIMRHNYDLFGTTSTPKAG